MILFIEFDGVSMLGFFRRYQKFFFLFVTIIVVISFSFFGTQGAMSGAPKVQDQPLGKSVDGSVMGKLEIDRLSRFLVSDRYDTHLSDKGRMPNFFNDGVIRRDFLETGLAEDLVEAYFPQLKESMEKLVAKHRRFRPYRHPDSPLVSVENLWNIILPELKGNFDQFTKGKEAVSPETFAQLAAIYNDASKLPSDLMRQYLMYLQSQQGVRRDPNLEQGELALFRAYTAEEWFGKPFIDLMAQVIHNGALFAEKQGYKVTLDEARSDLLFNATNAYQGIEKEGTEEGFTAFLRNQLAYLGLTEKEATLVWKKVLLFRRLFNDYGTSALVDSCSFEAFENYAKSEAVVDLYQLPNELNLRDFYSMLKLQLYIDLVSGKKGAVQLPKTPISAEALAKKHGSLVQRRYLVKQREVKLDEVAEQIGLKEMWDWQKEHADLLKKEFSELSQTKSVDILASLDELRDQMRMRIDLFSREQMVKERPEWILSSLAKAEAKRREIEILHGEYDLFPERGAFEKKIQPLLDKSALRDEASPSKTALEAKSDLEYFTVDGRTYYAIELIKRGDPLEILTFKEADERGILERLLDRELKAVYPQVRNREPALFKNEQDAWKSFEDVKEEVGRLHYADLLKSIERKVGKKADSLQFYATNRLINEVELAARQIATKGEQGFLQGQSGYSERDQLTSRPAFHDQFKLLKKKMSFSRTSSITKEEEKALGMQEGAWSNVYRNGRGDVSFYRVAKKTEGEKELAKKMMHSQRLLANEAKHYLMKQFLTILKEKEAIHIE